MRRAALLLLLAAACSNPSAPAALPTTTPSPTPSPTASPTPSPTASPTPTVGPDGCRIRTPLSPGSHVSVIGDSYTTGSPGKGGIGEKGWPAILAKRTGWVVYKDAQGASGYLSQGFTGKAFDGLIFLDQVAKLAAQKPDLVIVFGSDNDRGHTEGPYYRDKVDETLRAVRKAAPDAYLVVATTFVEDDHPSGELLYVRDVTRRATSRIRCAVFLDPIAENWFGASRQYLIYPHDDHPTDAGHVHLANLWERDLGRLHLV